MPALYCTFQRLPLPRVCSENISLPCIPEGSKNFDSGGSRMFPFLEDPCNEKRVKDTIEEPCRLYEGGGEALLGLVSFLKVLLISKLS